MKNWQEKLKNKELELRTRHAEEAKIKNEMAKLAASTRIQEIREKARRAARNYDDEVNKHLEGFNYLRGSIKEKMGPTMVREWESREDYQTAVSKKGYTTLMVFLGAHFEKGWPRKLLGCLGSKGRIHETGTGAEGECSIVCIRDDHIPRAHQGGRRGNWTSRRQRLFY